MDLIREVQEGIHSRSMKENDLIKIMDAEIEFIKINPEAREILNDFTEDGERLVANFTIKPIGKFCVIIENGKMYYEQNKWRDDAKVTAITDAKTWYELMITQRLTWDSVFQERSVVLEGNTKGFEIYFFLWDLFYAEIQLPTGFWKSSLVDLEPREMVAFHHPGPDPIIPAIDGLVQELKKKNVSNIAEIFLMHDKLMYYIDDNRNWHEAIPGGAYAMVSIGDGTNEKCFLTEKTEIISFEGGLYGSIPSRFYELDISCGRLRRFPFVKWSRKFGVTLNQAKQTIAKVKIPTDAQNEFYIDPRGFIDKYKENIDILIYNPIDR